MEHLVKNGITMLMYEVNRLVDDGQKESVKDIVDHMFNGDLVEYLRDKYKENIDLSSFNSSGPYSIKEINKAYSDFAGYISGNERRKWGISNNGLCLIVSTGIDLLRD